MHEKVTVRVADLLVDVRNARLEEEQQTQQAAILALAQQQGRRILKLAQDIVERGLDPTALPAIVATDDLQKRYLVLEGNRRIVALKALETPSLITPVMKPNQQRKLMDLARRFARNPIDEVSAVLFSSEDEASHWITVRHTGQNEGVGLVEWGANEKDRYAARHGRRSLAGQVLDFVRKHGSLSKEAVDSKKGILTSVERLISNPTFRERLGLQRAGNQVLSLYPPTEVAKGLSKVVEDLLTDEVKVTDIYHAEQREAYATSLPSKVLPNPATRLAEPATLEELTKGEPSQRVTVRPGRRKKKGREQERTALIPKDCQIEIDPPRINRIYIELTTLSADQYANACSVLLRVFVELSVDHYLETKSVISEQNRRAQPLAKRMKAAAKHLRSEKKISESLERAVDRMSDSSLALAASTVTFNQYVHNQYVYPKAAELKIGWDELQPFIVKLWSA
jgi:hypothetical protein